jgi:hypothetical protein
LVIHNVTCAQVSHELGQLRPVSPDTADLLSINRGRAGGFERFKLAGQLLAFGADPGIADNGHLVAPFRKYNPQTIITLKLLAQQFFVASFANFSPVYQCLCNYPTSCLIVLTSTL